MIAIRPARPEDAAAIAAIYAPYVLGGTVSFETEAPDARAIRGRMAASDGLYQRRRLCISTLTAFNRALGR